MKSIVASSNPKIYKIFKAALDKAGFEVLLCEDPSHIENLIKSDFAGLVLFDIQSFPQSTTITKNLLDIFSSQGLEIAWIIKEASTDIMEKGNLFGVRDYFLEPHLFNELVQKLGSMIPAQPFKEESQGLFSLGGLSQIVEGLLKKKETGKIQVSSAAIDGKLEMSHGILVAAHAGNKNGDEAVKILLSLASGQYQFEKVENNQKMSFSPDEAVTKGFSQLLSEYHANREGYSSYFFSGQQKDREKAITQNQPTENRVTSLTQTSTKIPEILSKDFFADSISEENQSSDEVFRSSNISQTQENVDIQQKITNEILGSHEQPKESDLFSSEKKNIPSHFQNTSEAKTSKPELNSLFFSEKSSSKPSVQNAVEKNSENSESTKPDFEQSFLSQEGLTKETVTKKDRSVVVPLPDFSHHEEADDDEITASIFGNNNPASFTPSKSVQMEHSLVKEPTNFGMNLFDLQKPTTPNFSALTTNPFPQTKDPKPPNIMNELFGVHDTGTTDLSGKPLSANSANENEIDDQVLEAFFSKKKMLQLIFGAGLTITLILLVVWYYVTPSGKSLDINDTGEGIEQKRELVVEVKDPAVTNSISKNELKKRDQEAQAQERKNKAEIVKTLEQAKEEEVRKEVIFKKSYEAGVNYFKSGNVKKALPYLKSAVETNPNNFEARKTLGKAFYESEDTRNAEEHLKQAVKINSNDAEAYLNLGSVYASSGKTKSAIQAYRQYLKLEPNGKHAKDVKAILNDLK